MGPELAADNLYASTVVLTSKGPVDVIVHPEHEGRLSQQIPVANAALAADPSPAKPQYTRAEIGKLRRRYYTKEFGKVTACGHKFHPTDEPHDKCPDCWEAYFMVQEGIRIGVESIISTFGMAQLIKVRGSKFAKAYQRFVAAHPIMNKTKVAA